MVNALAKRAVKRISVSTAATILAVAAAPLHAEGPEVPDIPMISVKAVGGSVDKLMPGWEKLKRPATLGGRERQAILEHVSGGGLGGVPVPNTIQTQGKTPTLTHLLLTVRRPWFVHRGFLAGEGVARLDGRAAMRFDESVPGRAIVGLNVAEGLTYLVDFLIQGEGAGDYVFESTAGAQVFADPDAERTHVLVAITAENSGWTEISLRRDGGAFDLHTVEITLAQGPQEGAR